MNRPTKNRITGFFIGIVLIPILMGVCVVVFFLAITLPILCFFAPEIIKLN
jgi:tetrahydromethanopterin S-methyltransferase subunit F